MPRPAWTLGLVAALMASSAAVHGAVTQKARVLDFTRRVEVVTGGRLRPTSERQAELTVSVWNKGKQDMYGPVFLIVDDTGLESVTVGSHTELTQTGKPVFQIVPVGVKIAPGDMTESLPIAFHIPAGMTLEEARQLKLTTRVFGQEVPESAQKPRKDDDSDFATRGKKYDQAALDAAFATQKKVTPQLMAKPHVLATAITETDKGDLAILVYTETRSSARELPGQVDGYPVEVRAVPGGSGEAFATTKSLRTNARPGVQQAPAAKPQLVEAVDPQVRFDRPVPIGVSAFNAETPICASGTLGVRCVDVSGKLYALSNAHVFSDNGYAPNGQIIVQPSQGDNNCNTEVETNTIGTLVDTVRYVNNDPASRYGRPTIMSFNVLDCALMAVSDGLDPDGNTVPAVGFATPADGYGAPSSKVLHKNRLGLQVQKYGRTTGYTRARTTAMNVMSPIAGATAADTVEFFRLDEFRSPSGTPFAAPGDSGSLIVTLDGNRPLSHLFAGNQVTGSVFGTPIGPVLDRFNVRIDDGKRDGYTTEGAAQVGLPARGGIAVGNITQQDVDNVVVRDTNDNIIARLLPPELKGRVKNSARPLIPAIQVQD